MVKVIVTLPSDRTAADFTCAVRPGTVEESVTQLAQVGDCISELSVESWALETRPLPSCCTRARRAWACSSSRPLLTNVPVGAGEGVGAEGSSATGSLVCVV